MQHLSEPVKPCDLICAGCATEHYCFFWKGSIVLQGYIGVVEDDQFWDVWAICLWFKWFGFDLILCSNEVWILDRILHIFSSNDAPFSLLAMSTFKVDVPQWQSEVGPVLAPRTN